MRRPIPGVAAIIAAFAIVPAVEAAKSPAPPGQAGKAARCGQPGNGGGEAKGHARKGEALECLVQSGAGVQRADFNADGIGDLAVGVPDENLGPAGDAGAVHIFYGSPGGLAVPGNQLLVQSRTRDGQGDVPEGGDAFGSALAAADFNGDGFADLAVGAPREDVGTVADAGSVTLFWGSSTGLRRRRPGTSAVVILTQGQLPGGALESGDLFGFALAWGALGRGEVPDLAIGAPGEGVGIGGLEVPFAGAVHALYGTVNGPETGNAQTFTQAAFPDPVEAFDRFGSTLTSGEFGRGAPGDLAVGVPLEDVAGRSDAGAVDVLYSAASNSGLATTAAQHFTQDTPDIEQVAGSGDRFGSALTAGDPNADGTDSLVIGAPFDDVFVLASESVVRDAGVVNVIHSAPGATGTLSGAGDQVLDESQLTTGIDFAEPGDRFGTALAVNRFSGDLGPGLAVGVPFEDVGAGTATEVADAGAVLVLYPAPAGQLDPNFAVQRLTQVDLFSPQDAEPGDRFGAALSAWNFGGRSSDADLAIGVPFETLGPAGAVEVPSPLIRAGEIDVVYGAPSGGLLLSEDQPTQRIDQGTTGVPEEPDREDHFGSVMY